MKKYCNIKRRFRYMQLSKLFQKILQFFTTVLGLYIVIKSFNDQTAIYIHSMKYISATKINNSPFVKQQQTLATIPFIIQALTNNCDKTRLFLNIRQKLYGSPYFSFEKAVGSQSRDRNIFQVIYFFFLNILRVVKHRMNFIVN